MFAIVAIVFGIPVGICVVLAISIRLLEWAGKYEEKATNNDA